MLYVIIFNHHKSAKNMQNLVNKLQFYHYGNLICFDILVIDMHTSCMSNNVYNQKKKQKETIQKSRLYLSCNAKVENCTIVQIWRVFSHKIKKKTLPRLTTKLYTEVFDTVSLDWNWKTTLTLRKTGMKRSIHMRWKALFSIFKYITLKQYPLPT